MISCSKRICVVPHRKIPSPGVTTEGSRDMCRHSCLLSDPVPHVWGYMGEPKGQMLLSLSLCFDMGNPMPTALTVLSGSHPAPLPSVWKDKKQRGEDILSVICLPSGRQREAKLPDFFIGSAQCEREAVQ